MEISNLTEHELLDINGGFSGKDIEDTYNGIKHVYTDLRDHAYDSAKNFAKGFADGITSVEFH